MTRSNGMRMLDLRLAERALKGEVPSQLAAGRISGLMKREEYRRKRYNQQVEKEFRIIRDRINFQERKFLSVQMFKKDLNPFMVVLKERHAHALLRELTVDGVGTPETGLLLPDVVISEMLPLPEMVRFKRNDTMNSHASPDIKHDIRREKIRNNKSVELCYDNGKPHDVRLKSVENDFQKTWLKPFTEATNCDGYHKFHKITMYGTDQSQSEQASDFFGRAKLANRVKFEHDRLNTEFSSTFIKDWRYSRRMSTFSGTATLSVEDPVRVAMAEAREILTTRSKSTFARPKPLVDKSAPTTRTTSYRALPSASKTKTYSDVLIDTCRALGPGEARKAESKRVEAEDATGITKVKSRMLKQCREGAELDVFSDVRWKGLITVLPQI